MKKFLAVILAAVIAMSMAACGSSAPAESGEEEKKALPVSTPNPEDAAQSTCPANHGIKKIALFDCSLWYNMHKCQR